MFISSWFSLHFWMCELRTRKKLETVFISLLDLRISKCSTTKHCYVMLWFENLNMMKNPSSSLYVCIWNLENTKQNKSHWMHISGDFEMFRIDYVLWHGFQFENFTMLKKLWFTLHVWIWQLLNIENEKTLHVCIWNLRNTNAITGVHCIFKFGNFTMFRNNCL